DIVVLQSAANGNPDVDAIFRLSNPGLAAKDITFNAVLPNVLMEPGVYSPYNAQATLHQRRGLWALYLPMSVHGRVSDIWRSYVYQGVFHVCGLHVGFTAPWVVHHRTAHNLVADLEAERDLYHLSSQLLDFIHMWQQNMTTRCVVPHTVDCNAAMLLQDL